MKRMVLSVLAAAAVAVPAPRAEAQNVTWWDWAAPVAVGGEQIHTRGGVIVVPEPRRDRGARDGQRRARANGNAPAFCRSGAGHPVHGRQWCLDKGWGLGNDRHDRRWERRGWEDVVFRIPQDRRRSALDERGLVETLGGVVFGRLQGHQQQLGARDPIVGRWISAGGGQVLQIRSGGVPVAELSDLDGDGRADLVLVFRGD